MLNEKIEGVELNVHEIQSLEVEEVAKFKAREAYRRLKKPLIVEDSGLYISAWKGFPGAFIKWINEHVGLEGLCRQLDYCKDRSAHAKTCICLCDGKEERLFIGIAHGSIAGHPRGSGGHGYDPVFVPEGMNKTFAEMEDEDRYKFSPRGKAFLELKKYIQRGM